MAVLNKKQFITTALIVQALLIVAFPLSSSQQAGSYDHHWHGRVARIKLVIEMSTPSVDILFNGMSIRDVYTYNVTDGKIILRYGGLNVMMNQISVWNAYFDYPFFRIEIPLKVLISNETISMEVYNDGGSYEDQTTIIFHNAHGELVASFTKYAYSVPPPLGTEIFHITSKDLH